MLHFRRTLALFTLVAVLFSQSEAWAKDTAVERIFHFTRSGWKIKNVGTPTHRPKYWSLRFAIAKRSKTIEISSRHRSKKKAANLAKLLKHHEKRIASIATTRHDTSLLKRKVFVHYRTKVRKIVRRVPYTVTRKIPVTRYVNRKIPLFKRETYWIVKKIPYYETKKIPIKSVRRVPYTVTVEKDGEEVEETRYRLVKVTKYKTIKVKKYRTSRYKASRRVKTGYKTVRTHLKTFRTIRRKGFRNKTTYKKYRVAGKKYVRKVRVKTTTYTFKKINTRRPSRRRAR